MGRKKVENPKNSCYVFRTTQEEMEILRAIASSEGITIAKLIREGLGLAKARRAIDGRLDEALKTLE